MGKEFFPTFDKILFSCQFTHGNHSKLSKKFEAEKFVQNLINVEIFFAYLSFLPVNLIISKFV